MATSTFLSRSAYPTTTADLSFGGFAAATASHAHHSHHHLAPHFSSQRLPLISASRLPSLEGLLKRMQDEPASPPSRAQHSPAAQSLADFSEHAYTQDHRLSPAGREVTPMPALRTIISPSMAKNAAAPVHSGFLSTASFPLDATRQYTAFPSRKRSWMEATSAETAFYPSKERAMSPTSSSVSSPSAPTTTANSSGPHRSRASKYCKIDGCERVSQRNNLCHSHGGKRLCKEDGCSSKDRGNGYCIKHGGGKICSMESCEKKARRKGLCTQHFRVSDDENPESMDSLHYDSM